MKICSIFVFSLFFFPLFFPFFGQSFVPQHTHIFCTVRATGRRFELGSFGLGEGRGSLSPCLCDDNVVEGCVLAPEARQSYLHHHCDLCACVRASAGGGVDVCVFRRRRQNSRRLNSTMLARSPEVPRTSQIFLAGHRTEAVFLRPSRQVTRQPSVASTSANTCTLTKNFKYYVLKYS